MTRVFNEQLAPFQKSVVDASLAAAAEEPDARFMCDAVFKQSSPETLVKGELLLILPSFFRFLIRFKLSTLGRPGINLFVPT